MQHDEANYGGIYAILDSNPTTPEETAILLKKYRVTLNQLIQFAADNNEYKKQTLMIISNAPIITGDDVIKCNFFLENGLFYYAIRNTHAINSEFILGVTASRDKKFFGDVIKSEASLIMASHEGTPSGIVAAMNAMTVLVKYI